MKALQTLRILVSGGAAFALGACATSTPGTSAGLDTDGDQRLSTAEVEVALVEAIFESADADGDGRVTAAEWQAANPQDSIGKFTPRDLNKDGGVTLEETLTYAKQSGMLKRVIADLNADADGYVSSADLDAFMKKHKLG